MPSRRSLLIAAPLLALTALSLASGLHAASPTSPRDAARPLVRVHTASAAPDTLRRVFTARVDAPAGAALAFTLPGRLTRRLADVGDAVRAGQPLAQLDERPLRHALQAARAELRRLQTQREQLERDIRRARALVAADAASGEELERLLAAAAGLDAGLDAARVAQQEAARQLGEVTLRAPFDGVLTAALHDVGDVVSPGSPAFIIGQRGEALGLTLRIPESMIAQLAPGQLAQVRAPLADLPPASARVVSVSAQAAPGTGLFTARLALDHAPGWRPGLTVEVALDLPAPAGVLVPLAAVISPDALAPSVLCVRQGRATPVTVELIALRDEGAVVRGALTPGEQVIVAGHFSVQRGAAVEVAP